MVRSRGSPVGGILFGLAAILVYGGLAWALTGYANQRVHEAVAYSRATFCPEAVDNDPNCVKVAGALVTHRARNATSDSVVYSVDLQMPGRSYHVDVGDEVYDRVRDGDEVTAWRFHDTIVGIERGGKHWTTRATPGPPYGAGLVGTLFWAGVFGGVALAASHNRTAGAPTRWDFRLYFGALAIAVGLVVGGAVLDYLLDVVRFDPRLIYVSLALTPAVSVAIVTKYTIKRLVPR